MVNAIALRIGVAAILLVPTWVLMARATNGGGGPRPGTPAADLLANATLVQAAQVLGAHRQSSGTFAGANLSVVPDARLVRADAATFCVEAGEDASLFHLDGTDRQDLNWNWGAVKGACAAQ